MKQIDIKKEKAHNNWVTYFNSYNGNRLLSGSYDNYIRVWTLSQRDIKGINAYTNWESRGIPLSAERFVSCSNDETVKMWKYGKIIMHMNVYLHYNILIK